MEAQQCVKLTDTNRPRACSYKDATRPLCSSRDTVGNSATSPYRFGDHGERETPGSIPNPEVKPLSADGTARGTVWETRTSPDYTPRGWSFVTTLEVFAVFAGVLGARRPGLVRGRTVSR